MSHELRTPLNAVLGFAQLLERDKREPLPERHRARVSQILSGGEHVLRILDDILDLSRIETGRITLTPSAVDVFELVERARTTLIAVAASSRVQLRVAPTPSEPVPFVEADPTRLMQILINYGSNGIKYNRPNGEVTFGAAVTSSRYVRISVADTGIGVPPEKQPLLFEPFQRAGQELGSIAGTGLGLAISKRLAERMNGSIGFESEMGRGSVFWVDVPRYEQS